MLQTEVTITNNSCGVVHLIGEQFEARIAGHDEFTGTMPASVFDANAAQFAASHPYVEIVEGETEDDGVPDVQPEFVPYSEKGEPSGVAPLDESGKIPTEFLP